jgi:hypothetical protein
MVDFRLGMDVGREVHGRKDLFPHKYTADEIEIIYGDMSLNELDDDAFEGFLKWFWDELMDEKVKQQQPLFRHKVFLLQGLQWVDVDVEYKSSITTIPEDAPAFISKDYKVGDEVKMLKLGLYTAIRSRNPEYTRLSFSAGEDMWDELGDLL